MSTSVYRYQALVLQRASLYRISAPSAVEPHEASHALCFALVSCVVVRKWLRQRPRRVGERQCAEVLRELRQHSVGRCRQMSALQSLLLSRVKRLARVAGTSCFSTFSSSRSDLFKSASRVHVSAVDDLLCCLIFAHSRLKHIESSPHRVVVQCLAVTTTGFLFHYQPASYRYVAGDDNV